MTAAGRAGDRSGRRTTADHARHRHDQADARRAAARARGRIRCRRCSASPRVRTSSCSRRSTASSRCDEPEPLQKLDPLTRGSLFHEVQAEFFRALQRHGRAAGDAATTLTAALATLDARHRARRAPSTRTSSRRRSSASGTTRSTSIAPRPPRLAPHAAADEPTGSRRISSSLRPARRRTRSAAAVPEPVARRRPLPAARLGRSRSSSTRRTRLLRVTDHKTGKNRSTWKTVIGGGAMLQPVLYSLAVEQALGHDGAVGPPVLLHAAGGFADHPIPLNDANRAQRPRGAGDHRSRDRARASCRRRPPERACTWCDFRPVCGPRRAAPRPRTSRGQARRSRSAEGEAMRTTPTCWPTPAARDRDRATSSTTTLVVEAAAGTGKTTELVKRIVRVLATGRADDRRDRRGDVHREGRRRAEAAPARGARDARADRRRAGGARARSNDALQTLEEAHVSTIHGFCAELLRERPVEARVDPLFAVLTEPQAERLFDEAFGALAPGAAAESARRRAPRAAAIESGRASAATAREDTPIDRLRRAGLGADPVARLPGAVDAAAVRSRRRRSIGWSTQLHEFAATDRRGRRTRRHAVPRHGAARGICSQEIALQQSLAAHAGDDDGWEARAGRSRRATATSRRPRHGRGPRLRAGRHARSGRRRATTRSQPRSTQFRLDADADLAARAAAGARRRDRRATSS